MVVWTPRNDRRRNLSAANNFGTVCEVFPADLIPYDFRRMRQIFVTDVLPLADREDKIIALGPTIMVSQFLIMWMANFGEPNLIVFDRIRQEYRPVPLL